MTIPTLRRPAAAWTFLVALIRALTTPSVTVADCDRQVEELAADSRIVRAISALADAWRRAVSDSIVVRTCRKTFVPISSSLADRVRIIAVVAGVAAATGLLPYAVWGADERDPYTWVLPVAAGCAAALVFAAAEPIARAIVHRQS